MSAHHVDRTKLPQPRAPGMAYCYNHQKLHKTLNRSKHSHNRLQLASIEEPGGIQLAITQICDALGKARIDDRKAHVLMYGLQLATQLALKAPKTNPSQVVQDLSLDEDGFLIATEYEACATE